MQKVGVNINFKPGKGTKGNMIALFRPESYNKIKTTRKDYLTRDAASSKKVRAALIALIRQEIGEIFKSRVRPCFACGKFFWP